MADRRTQPGRVDRLSDLRARSLHPASDRRVNVPIANLGTFVGAVGFFFAARLLIPEMDES